MIGWFKHYADSLQFRFHLLSEYFRLKQLKAVDSTLFSMILSSPGNAEDWINLLCFIDPDDPLLVIDIGANVGAFTGGALRYFPKARSICFEPSSEPFRVLEKRFDGDSRVVCHQVAISAREETQEMFVQKGASHYNTFHRYDSSANKFYGLNYDAVEEVQCRRLADIDFDATTRTLLKIDTQGHEVSVLEGAGAVLDAVDVVLIETSFANEYENLEPSFAEVAEILRKHELYPIIFQSFSSRNSNYPFERDVVFARKSLLQNIFFTS